MTATFTAAPTSTPTPSTRTATARSPAPAESRRFPSARPSTERSRPEHHHQRGVPEQLQPRLQLELQRPAERRERVDSMNRRSAHGHSSPRPTTRTTATTSRRRAAAPTRPTPASGCPSSNGHRALAVLRGRPSGRPQSCSGRKPRRGLRFCVKQRAYASRRPFSAACAEV